MQLEPTLLQFLEHYETTYQTVHQNIQNQQITPPTVREMIELFQKIRDESAPQWESIVETNDFHSTLLNENWQQYMSTDSEFLTGRFMINILYTIFLQLGLKPIERYLLCWMFARAVEDLRELNSIQLVKKINDIL